MNFEPLNAVKIRNHFSVIDVLTFITYPLTWHNAWSSQCCYDLGFAGGIPNACRRLKDHWATEAVHIIPVFGERGALLEHEVFCICYNWPLTIRRRMRKRGQKRDELQPRYWHIILCAIAGLGIFILADFVYLENSGTLPNLGEIWALVLLVPLLCGALVTLGAGGAAIPQRIVGASIWGILIGMLYTVVTVMIGYDGNIRLVEVGSTCLWRVFLFSIFSAIGVIFTELLLPEPSSK